MCDGQSAKFELFIFLENEIFFLGRKMDFGTLAVAHFFYIDIFLHQKTCQMGYYEMIVRSKFSNTNP